MSGLTRGFIQRRGQEYCRREMDTLYAYDCSVDTYALSDARHRHLDKPFPLLSTDRLSTVRFRLAKHLGQDPNMIYVEIHSDEGIRVTPFQYIANPQYSRHYTDEVNYRPTPAEYNEQGDRVFTLGPLVISKAFLAISRQFPRLHPLKAVQLMFNLETLETFFRKGQKLVVKALCMD